VPAPLGTLAGLVIVFSASVAALAPPEGWRRYAWRTAVTTAFFCTLIGLGAAFGKVLGDFLRGVN
jgi:hypothetical protein